MGSKATRTRNKKIVKQYSTGKKTLKEIGEKYGLSKVRVFQIVEEAKKEKFKKQEADKAFKKKNVKKVKEEVNEKLSIESRPIVGPRTDLDIPTLIEKNRYIEGQPWKWSGTLTRPNGTTFDFALEPWLVVLRDPSRRKFIYKCRKVAFSEVMMSEELMFLMKYPYTTINHYLQNQKVASEFVRDRLDIAIAESELKNYVKYHNVHQKGFKIDDQTHEQFIHVKWPKSSELAKGPGVSARSAACDYVFVDELQLFSPVIMGVIEPTMHTSAFGWLRTGGTPMTEKGPLDVEFFDHSDQKGFVYKCGKCGHWTDPHEKDVRRYILCSRTKKPYFEVDPEVRENPYWGCEYCGASFNHIIGRLVDNEDGFASAWATDYMQRVGKSRYSGYRFTPMTVKLRSMEDLVSDILKYQETDPRHLANEVLGFSYSGGDVPFPPEVIKAGMVKDRYGKLVSMDYLLNKPKFEYMIFGIDWGEGYSYMSAWGLCNEEYTPVLIGLFEYSGDPKTHGDQADKDIERLLAKCPEGKYLIVCDVGYSAGRFQDLVKKHRHRCWGINFGMTRYKPTEKKTVKDKWDIRDKEGKTIIDKQVFYPDRNYAFEHLAMKVRDGTAYWVLPGLPEALMEKFVRHFANIVPRNPEREATESGGWMETRSTDYQYGRVGPDHWALTTIFMEAGRQWITRRTWKFADV